MKPYRRSAFSVATYVALWYLFASHALPASSVFVTNHSFEVDLLPRDGDPGTLSPGVDDYDPEIVPAGWLGFDDGRGSGGIRGLASVASDSFFSSMLSPTPDTDVNDQAFLTAARDVYQVLSTNLAVDTTYTLSVDVGVGTGSGTGSPVIHLGTGATPGTNILAYRSSDQPTPVAGDWVTWTFVYKTDLSPPGLGQPLRIELTEGSAVVWFDNVRLEAVPAPPLRLAVSTSGDNLRFAWPSKEKRVYDLLFDDNRFGTASPATWTVYQGWSGITYTSPTNYLTVPFPSGAPAGFFAVREREQPIKILLLGGQSNMKGYTTDATELPAELQSPQEDVLFFHDGTATLQPLQPGTGYPFVPETTFGPEITFGRDIADAFTNEQFALIKHAEGGTDLEYDWDPVTGSSYANFRQVVEDGTNALLAAGYAIEIVGMLWTQGESDAIEGYTSTYESNMHEFIGDIRSRYGANLPFFISQLSSKQTYMAVQPLDLIKQAQANVAAADTNSYLIVTDPFEMSGDNLHFSSAGQMALGSAFADAYNALP